MSFKEKRGTAVSHEPMFLEEAIRILGWQGGTVHQVLEVLRYAKAVSAQYHESSISGNWELMQPRLQSLKDAVVCYAQEKCADLDCVNFKCSFYDGTGAHEQQCMAGDSDDNPFLPYCDKYIPGHGDA